MKRGTLRKKFVHAAAAARDSFWLVPLVQSLVAGGLAVLTLWLDESIWPSLGDDVTWLFGGTAAGASTLLQVIAGSLITVISVVFSITLIAMQQASTQYSPRLQDPLFGIEQMVDVAVKALSPSINDPATATQALDQVAAAVSLLHALGALAQSVPSPARARALRHQLVQLLSQAEKSGLGGNDQQRIRQRGAIVMQALREPVAPGK
jgi:uncharacterized membrane protein